MPGPSDTAIRELIDALNANNRATETATRVQQGESLNAVQDDIASREEESKKQQKSSSDNSKHLQRATAIWKKIPGQIMAGAQKLASPLVGAFKEGFAQFDKMDTFGAKFNKSIGQNWTATRELANKLGGAGGISSDLDAFKFGLEIQNIGLNKNSSGLQKMWRATQRSGEDFNKLTGGIKNATAGFDSTTLSIDSLINTQETLVNSLNLTRSQLVEAMNSLSEETKDMSASLGIKGLQETQMQMRGFLKNEALFGKFTKNMEGMLGAGGLVKSVQLGVESARGEVLGGGANMKNMFEMVFKGASRSREMLAGAGGTQLGPEIRAMLSEAGVIADSNIRLEQEIRRNAVELLKDTRSEKEIMAMTGDQLASEVSDKLQQNAAQQKEFGESLATLKKSILLPMINAGAQVAQSIKNFLSKNKADLGDVVKKISIVVLKVANALMKFATFLKDSIMPHLGKMVVALGAMAGAKAGSGVGTAIGAVVGGIAGSIIPGAGTIAGAALGAKLGGWIGGATGAAGGAYAGYEATKAMGDKGGKGPLDDMIAHLEEDSRKSEEIRANTDAAAQAGKAQVEILEESKEKGDLRQLVDSLDGFSRFQVRQSSLIEENLVELNGQIGKVEENTGVAAEAGVEQVAKSEGIQSVITTGPMTDRTPLGG